MTAIHDLRLVILSIAIAVVAAYTALDLAKQVTFSRDKRLLWLLGGAIAMGTGIWAMHFVGMLAYGLPIPVHYDLVRVSESIVVAVIASGTALFVASRPQMSNGQLLIGSVCMGLAIAGMHYIGMSAMRLDATPHYDAMLVGGSLVVALSASSIALWLAFKLRSEDGLSGVAKLGSAVLMGLAIAGTHYTAMVAVHFQPQAQTSSLAAPAINTTKLATGVGVATVVILLLTLLASIVDRRVSTNMARAAALRQSEERFRSLVQNASDVIVITSESGVIAYSSQSSDRMLGHTPEHWIDRTLAEFVHPDDQAELDRLLHVAPHSLVTAELRLRHANGEWRDFEVIANNAIDDSSVAGIVMTYRDIRDRKLAQQTLEQLLKREQAARAEAEAANRVKDEFLAVLSHELRTPLSPILGWTQLLRGGCLGAEKVDAALETIERNAILQAQLIEDLLDVSRILQGKLSLKIVPVQLVHPVKAALETTRLSAEAKQIHIQTSFDPEIEPVLGDADRLQQVVWNLLSNAIKFTPAGGKIEVRLQRHNAQAQLQVRDTGKGISPNFLPYVFEYFRQADSSTTRSFGGLGLGLAIVRHLVELHGGTVTADSAGEGQGATFTVELPLLSTKPGAIEPAATPKSSQVAPLSGLRILVVEDDLDTQELIAFLLEQSGAIAFSAPDAVEALQLFALTAIDVLISDIGMPETDGYELIRHLRSLPPEQGGTVPAIALTAYAGEGYHQQALVAGFDYHLAKPVDATKLIQAIVELSSARARSSER